MIYKMKDIASFSQGKQVDIRDQYSNITENHPIRFIRIVDYTNRYEPPRYIKDYGKRYYASHDEVVMIRYGSQTAGMVKMGMDGIIANNIFKINFNNEIIDNKYGYYYLSQPRIFNFLRSSQSSSTMPAISFGIMNEIEISVPDMNTQKKIINILNLIDDSITLCNNINNKLEELSINLFNKYFLTDDSNHAIIKLKDITKNNRDRVTDNDYKVLSAVNTGNLVFSDDYFDKKVYSKDITKYLVVKKNCFAYNPARVNIGSIGLNNYDDKCCVSPVYVTFSVEDEYVDFFNFFFKSKSFLSQVNMRASGSVRQVLSYDSFGEIEIKMPTQKEIHKFNSDYKSIKQKMDLNNLKIKYYQELLDFLLPKLMNGEIDLSNIEI